MPDRPFPPPDKTLTTPGPGGYPSSSPSTSGGFPPGTIFAGRYQIVSPLGRGGMGMVYRAEDLKLGQPVALKFLPPELSDDQAMLLYLYAEVRNARQISHPNICRVHDIGEQEGRHFLSMEYVDGEDLASLLKRIGRLPAQKALEISREICAGLAAAHEQGVIHRDLKPANIMIDGRGQARIMDFGLAIKTVEGTQAREFAGTPAYMAPEQLAGMGTSVKSNIYSLGLVLYELFTGRRVLEAESLEEIRRRQMTESPRPPSSYALDINPEIDRVIMRCLDRDPSSRPASVLEVATSLPGGDPLKAALAAGRTPTPEMVAAAGKEGSLEPPAAWGLLGLFVAFPILAIVLAPRSVLMGAPGFKKSPDVLTERAREVIESIGYKESPEDSACWFEADEDLIYWLQENHSKIASQLQIQELETRSVRFRYRQSPRRLVPSRNQGIIQEDNPPLNVPGMISIDLNSQGRLLRFLAIPESSPVPGESTESSGWMFLPGAWSSHIELNSLLGWPQQLGTILYIIGFTSFYGVGWMVATVFSYTLVRKTWLVAVVFVFFGSVSQQVGSSGDLSAQVLSALIFSGIVAGLLLGYGFLPAAISFFVYSILVRMPLRLGLPGWSARASVLTLIIVAAIAIYGFYTSLGGRPIFVRIDLDG